MGCKGQCLTYAVDKQSHKFGYLQRKRCGTCSVYLPDHFIRCPCCSYPLKTKARKRNDMVNTLK